MVNKWKLLLILPVLGLAACKSTELSQAEQAAKTNFEMQAVEAVKASPEVSSFNSQPGLQADAKGPELIDYDSKDTGTVKFKGANGDTFYFGVTNNNAYDLWCMVQNDQAKLDKGIIETFIVAPGKTKVQGFEDLGHYKVFSFCENANLDPYVPKDVTYIKKMRKNGMGYVSFRNDDKLVRTCGYKNSKGVVMGKDGNPLITIVKPGEYTPFIEDFDDTVKEYNCNK